MKEYKQEMLKFINENNMSDIFIYENDFYKLYNVDLYVYFRISTGHQEFERQVLELYKWAKKKNITIYINNIYYDQYTGKKMNRKAYKEMRSLVKENDYILVSEVSRIGRNWDGVKKEWYNLKAENINILVMDSDLLCANLPNEEKEQLTIDKKFVQEMVFNGVLYVACKKIEEVGRSTKDGLEKARMKGKELGRPKGKNSTKENFIETLRLQVEEGYSIIKATNKTLMPPTTYKYWLREYKKKADIYENAKILNLLEKGAL